jgi:hypothetical protein
MNPDWVMESEPELAGLFAVYHRLVSGFVRRYDHAAWVETGERVQAMTAADDGGVIGVNCELLCPDTTCGWFHCFLCGPTGYGCVEFPACLCDGGDEEP